MHSESDLKSCPEDGVTTLTLLVWDAPNLDMSLAGLLGRQPCPMERPRFDAVGRWLLDLAADCSDVEACVFTNVAAGSAQKLGRWVKALRGFGFGVFVKPKIGDSDVDKNILDHIADRRANRTLCRLVVASHDGQAFSGPLRQLADEGVDVVVLGFTEDAGYADASSSLRLVDLEDIPEVFLTPLPRARLDHLPTEGRWLSPTAPLTALREHATNMASLAVA